MDRHRLRPMLAGLLSGVLFGIGLAVSGMTDPSVVTGFLDVAGAWNPALAFVMAGALAVTAVGYRLVFRRAAPLWAPAFQLPTARTIDLPLVGGAALFGIGWGLAGYCPGPALASLSGGWTGTLVFLATLLVGLWLAKRLR